MAPNSNFKLWTVRNRYIGERVSERKWVPRLIQRRTLRNRRYRVLLWRPIACSTDTRWFCHEETTTTEAQTDRIHQPPTNDHKCTKVTMPTHCRRNHKNRRSLCSSTPTTTTIREEQDETTETVDTPHKAVTDLKDSFLSTLTLASRACHGDIFLDDQSVLLQKVQCQYPQSYNTTNDNDDNDDNNNDDEEQQQQQQILQEMRRLNKIKARRKKKRGNDDNLFRATMVMGKRRDLWEQPQRFQSDNYRYQFTNAPILEVVVDNAVSSLSSSSGKSPNMIQKKKNKKMKDIPLVRTCSTFTTVAGSSSLDDTATTTSTLYSANDRRLQEYRKEQDDNDSDSFLEQILDGSEEDDTDSADDDDDEFENLLVSHDNASVELSPSEDPNGWCSDDSAAASMLHDKYSVFS